MAMPLVFHEGNRAEYLAMYFLSKVGLVVPVPRQSDLFGVDFIVHLVRAQQDCIIPTGKSFAIQVKSNNDPISYNGEKLSCLNAMGLPFFVGVVLRDGLEFTIYPTLSRLNFMWMKGADRDFTLCPGGTLEDLHAKEWPDKNVRTGPEAVRLKAEELDSTATESGVRQQFFSTMSAWIEFEEASLSWRTHNIPLVEMPQDYTPNVPPDSAKRYLLAYANPKTLARVCQAVWGPMFSLGYYLHDLLRRHGNGSVTVSEELVTIVKHLDSAVEIVKEDTKRIVESTKAPQEPKAPKAET